jgi:hypothetical protein
VAVEGRLGLSSRTLPGATLISVEGELDAAVADGFDLYVRRMRQGPADHLAPAAANTRTRLCPPA